MEEYRELSWKGFCLFTRLIPQSALSQNGHRALSKHTNAAEKVSKASLSCIRIHRFKHASQLLRIFSRLQIHSFDKWMVH